MADKIFIGNCKAGKYPDQVDIGFNKEHLDKMYAALNDKGWMNVRVNKGKDSGKPYMEIVQATAIPTAQTQQPAGVSEHSTSDDLHF